MKLLVERKWCNPDCTIGIMTSDKGLEVYTLEDVERKEKVFGETAIPKGSYNVSITPSQRFKRDLPLVENVPGFEGIRIHPGNTAADTHGCLLVGRTKGPTWVGESRAAFNDVYREIKGALDSGEQVILEIV
jgi:hypothetical protein